MISRFFAGEEYGQLEFAEVLNRFADTGYFVGVGDELETVKVSGLQGKTKTGECFIKGYWGKVEEEETFNLDAGDPTNARWDRRILRLDVLNKNISLAVLKGTPSANPEPPELTRNSSIWELSLAKLKVNAGSNEINEIVDERNDSSVCGGAKGGASNMDVYDIESDAGVQCTFNYTLTAYTGYTYVNGLYYFISSNNMYTYDPVSKTVTKVWDYASYVPYLIRGTYLDRVYAFRNGTLQYFSEGDWVNTTYVPTDYSYAYGYERCYIINKYFIWYESSNVHYLDLTNGVQVSNSIGISGGICLGAYNNISKINISGEFTQSIQSDIIDTIVDIYTYDFLENKIITKIGFQIPQHCYIGTSYIHIFSKQNLFLFHKYHLSSQYFYENYILNLMTGQVFNVNSPINELGMELQFANDYDVYFKVGTNLVKYTQYKKIDTATGNKKLSILSDEPLSLLVNLTKGVIGNEIAVETGDEWGYVISSFKSETKTIKVLKV